MGTSKATIELAGRPLVQYPLAALARAGLPAVVVAKADSALPPIEAPVWLEPEEPRHPLAGILAALERANGPVVVVGCDMPFVAPELLAYLATLAVPVALPAAGGRLHPLLARYEPSLAESLEAALGERSSLHAAVTSLDPVLIDEGELERFGEPERLLFNVNTPADLRRAEALLARG